jgi:hypothetical protein
VAYVSNPKTPGSEPSRLAIRLQIAALGVAGVAVLFGVFCVYGTAFPGPCGDNPGPSLGLLESWLVDAPIGLLVLAAGLFIAKGLPLLRTICILAALATPSLPIIAGLFFQRWHCP